MNCEGELSKAVRMGSKALSKVKVDVPAGPFF